MGRWCPFWPSARPSRAPTSDRDPAHRNSTGSFQSAARFSDSWNSPSATAPSPKKHVVVSDRPQALEVHPVERDRDRLDERIAHGVRVADPLALDQLEPAPGHRTLVEGFED
jgi:hypothetical protein